jgi:hypothetical protein
MKPLDRVREDEPRIQLGFNKLRFIGKKKKIDISLKRLLEGILDV